jgi:uncharacterized protein
MSVAGDYAVFDLPREAREAVLRRMERQIAEHEDIVFAYAHGSFVEEGSPFRDIDVAVYMRGTPAGSTFDIEDRLAQELRRAADVSCPVDVRVANGAPIPFQYHACRGRLLTDQDPALRADVTAWVVARYLDLKPVLRHHAREAFGDDPVR